MEGLFRRRANSGLTEAQELITTWNYIVCVGGAYPSPGGGESDALSPKKKKNKKKEEEDW